jgi:hypothetical protein
MWVIQETRHAVKHRQRQSKCIGGKTLQRCVRRRAGLALAAAGEGEAGGTLRDPDEGRGAVACSLITAAESVILTIT